MKRLKLYALLAVVTVLYSLFVFALLASGKKVLIILSLLLGFCWFIPAAFVQTRTET